MNIKNGLMISLFLVGCSSQKQITIDPSSSNYFSQPNTVMGSLSMVNQISAQDDTLIFYEAFNLDQVGTSALFQTISQKDPSDPQILNNTANSQCSYQNINSCSGLITNEIPYYYQTYNNKIYYLTKRMDNKNDEEYYAVIEMELDGSDRKEYLKLDALENSAENYMPAIYFDQGYLYYTFGKNQITKIDMSTKKETEFAPYLEGSFYIFPFFTTEGIYFNIHEYNNDGLIVSGALVKYLEENQLPEIIDEQVSVFFIDNLNYFYYQQYSDGTFSTHIYMKNLNTGERYEFEDHSTRVVSNGQYYIMLDVVPQADDTTTLRIVDQQGNIKLQTSLTYPEGNLIYLQGIFDKYIYYTDFNKIYYIEIDSDAQIISQGIVSKRK